MTIAAIVLAGGEGRRAGGPKALLRLGGETFLARVARLLSRPGVTRLVAVLGHDAERVAAEAGLPAVAIRAVNRGYREGGMLSSILCGLDAAGDADAVLIHPVDHPVVAEATVDAVIAALRAGAAIAVPSFSGRRGHPGGFARASFPLLRAAPPERGLRAVLHDRPELVVHVEGDAGCLAGVNTPADLERLGPLGAP